MLLHGLEGSSLAHYMGGISDKAWAAGWNVVRLNQRNCGNTEHLSRGLYHSGLTHDPLFVMRELIERDGIRRSPIAGYSLGGNLALKLAGELGDAAPPELTAVCAVSPTMDLARVRRRARAAVELRLPVELRPATSRRGCGGRRRRFPARSRSSRCGGSGPCAQFDEAYTAPHHGFRDAADYYHRASALRVIDRIRVPALIITAEDDPFVPDAPFRDPAVTGNPHITVVITPHGGHCAYRRARRRRLRRLLGGAGDRAVCVDVSAAEMLHQHARANSGPFPTSSCLK